MISGVSTTQSRKFQFFDEIKDSTLPNDDIIANKIVEEKEGQEEKSFLRELDVNILVSGHTHRPMIKEEGEILLLNPGSPTQPRLSEPSVMLLEIKGKEVNAEVVKIGEATCKALDFSQFIR